MAPMAKLIDLVSKLETLDQQATIYAAEPWNFQSEAFVTVETLEGNPSNAVNEQRLKYFIEVSIAREFLADWESRLSTATTDRDRCNRLIQYAISDA